MKTLFANLLAGFLAIMNLGAQQAVESSMVLNPDFNKKINSYLNYSIPTVSVAHLVDVQDDVVILDAREWEEFETSHIPNAKYIGYKKLNEEELNKIGKDETIVLYCSIGYRSEKMGEKLKKKGYTKVFNLYGSIFEWVNQGHEVVDKSCKQTNRVHTYNRKWSKWVDAVDVEKIY